MYAEAIKTGTTGTAKKSRQQVLDTTIQTLITCLQEVKEFAVLSESQARGNGNSRWRFGKKFSGKKKVLNLSKRDFKKAEYSFLGRGLKVWPKTKYHYVIQLKQDVLEFTRKLRLKEFFADTDEDSDGGGDVMTRTHQYRSPPVSFCLVKKAFHLVKLNDIIASLPVMTALNETEKKKLETSFQMRFYLKPFKKYHWWSFRTQIFWPSGYNPICLYIQTIIKTRLFKYVENFTSKN